jgi:Na+-driven multidrug efflux pump
VLIILFTKRWSVPHAYLTIGSGWGLFSCMLGTGYLLVFQTPPLWLLIGLRFLEGVGLLILFHSCLHLFHWGIWYKVKAWKFKDKQKLELAVGK